MIEAKIIADSIAPSGVRLTTFVLTYPRFIHSEFMTHRVFSRNASSSRAIPVKKQIQMVVDNPAIPLAFTKNKAGMQGGEALDEYSHALATDAWLAARDQAVIYAKSLSDLEVHKQYANRILEPWAHITVVCTATEWANFFALRIHPAAQPEIQALADAMYEEMQKSSPRQLGLAQWHLPFITDDEKADPALSNQRLIEMSVARCARVSYLNHDGTKTTLDQDLQLYNRLLGAAPIHASPAEHQAAAFSDAKTTSGNFRGWIQYRQLLKDQNITEFKK